MPVDIVPIQVDRAFAQIANADIETLLKQLTLDEKVALLTGSVSATLKHFVRNDQEHEGMAVAITLGNPNAIITAYNKMNGLHAAENTTLLQDILRGEWAWNGLVMSDWFGTYSTSEAINAGQDLEMPGPPRWRGTALNHAVTSNKIPLATLNARVRAMLKLFQKASKSGISERAPETQSNQAEDRNPARKIAAEGIVLLKNEENILLFNKNKRIPVIGTNAKIATYRGGGSAVLNPYYTVTPFDDTEGYFVPKESGLYDFGLTVHGTGRLFVDGKELISNADVQRAGTSFFSSGTLEEAAFLELEAGRRYKVHLQWGCGRTGTFRVPGVVDLAHGSFRFRTYERLSPQNGIAEAARVTSSVDQVISVAGQSTEWETEGEHRSTMSLPHYTDELISRVLQSNPNMAIVIQSGTPV
ncbi:Glycoside hydrolase family 3, partial [Penicillium chrysogenum]